MTQMTTLTQSPQVIFCVMGRVMIKMRCGKNDALAGFRVGLIVHCATKLAAPSGPFKADVMTDKSPIMRVTAFIYRHITPSTRV